MDENQIGYKLFQLLKELDIHDFNSWKNYKEEIALHTEKKIELGGILEMILNEYYKQ